MHTLFSDQLASPEGLQLEEIKTHLLDLLSRTHFLGVLDTLDYVRRSGCLNGALASLGDTLGIKPILTLKHGEIIPAGIARTAAGLTLVSRN